MGSVWEARHTSLGTPSAIKFIDAEYAKSVEARTRFDREAKAAATIQSKHAIQIYDHGVTEDGKPYIVMELLTGEPLDKRIERLGALTLQDTGRILRQVARGLSRAHERGIVHRDLKPENIFIVRNTDDDDEVAKVLDFGIAKIQTDGENSGVASSTKTGAVLGTPFYMSPEQARGLRNVDHRTDIWSLGVIAFKCVTGRMPFDGESVGDLLVKICTAPLPVPSHALPGLPQAFDVWFARALEREPERRFATVLELADQLALAAGLGARQLTPAPNLGGGSAGAIAVARRSSNDAGSPGSDSGGALPTPQHAGVAYGGTERFLTDGDRQPSPQPGWTAAPFTSSQFVTGVTPIKWKWVVASAGLGLALAGIGTGAVVAVRRRDAAAANRVDPSSELNILTAAPSALPPKTGSAEPAEVLAATPSSPRTVTSPPGSAPLLAGDRQGLRSFAGAKASPKPSGGTVLVAPALPLPLPGTPPGSPSGSQPPAAAVAPGQIPPTPPKKPSKNDPGY